MSGPEPGPLRIGVIIPTFGRGEVLLDTIEYVLAQRPAPAELLVVDQTPDHPPAIAAALSALEASGSIRWVRLPEPSITRAMNVGLQTATSEIVLFLDDDVIPSARLVAEHLHAHLADGHLLVAGQVLQPGESPDSSSATFHFASATPRFIGNLMAGNFSVRRQLAIGLGGFDENFVRVAYRFETEFAERAVAAGIGIWFWPAASIRHLRAARGGTRSFGHHLRTARPGHAVGAYYYLLRGAHGPGRTARLLNRVMRSIATRHHLTHPWWIPVTLVAEACGLVWALWLAREGPRFVRSSPALR